MVSRTNALRIVFGVNLALLVALGIVGILAHSTATWAAAGDYIADALAIALAMASDRLATRPPTVTNTYGFERFSVLSGFATALLVLATCCAVALTATARLIHGVPTLNGAPVAIVSLVAALAMAIGALLLRDDHQLSSRALFLESAGDAIAAMCVSLVGLITWLVHGWYILDPLVAIAVAVVIGWRGVGLVHESIQILTEGAPAGITSEHIRTALLASPNVVDVHDLHVWGIGSESLVLTAHVVLEGDPALSAATATLAQLRHNLREQFGITHSTFEAEHRDGPGHDAHA